MCLTNYSLTIFAFSHYCEWCPDSGLGLRNSAMDKMISHPLVDCRRLPASAFGTICPDKRYIFYTAAAAATSSPLHCSLAALPCSVPALYSPPPLVVTGFLHTHIFIVPNIYRAVQKVSCCQRHNKIVQKLIKQARFFSFSQNSCIMMQVGIKYSTPDLIFSRHLVTVKLRCA